VIEPAATRDHTERALVAFGASVAREGTRISVSGGQRLEARDLAIPGDLSSATFWMALAASTPGSAVEIEGLGLNPSRTAVVDVIRRAGARIDVTDVTESAGEPLGRVRVSSGTAKPLRIEPDEVPGLIDEIPALAAMVALGPEGREFQVSGASELRVKESDRITALAEGFRAMGAHVEEFEDGFRLVSRPLKGAILDAAGDHRLAMAFAIAATAATGPVTITGASAVAVSYPGFFDELERLTGRR
jgi:3-phosphoshikimate 1-carboxyvinyltransferase